MVAGMNVWCYKGILLLPKQTVYRHLRRIRPLEGAEEEDCPADTKFECGLTPLYLTCSLEIYSAKWEEEAASVVSVTS